jgi:hypothetical protein
MDQLADLLADRFDDSRWAVAEQVAPPARKEIEIPLPFRIPHVGALAADQRERVPTIIGYDVFFERRDDFGG